MSECGVCSVAVKCSTSAEAKSIAFKLKGFESERKEVDSLIVKYKEDADKFIQSGGCTLDIVLGCPMAMSYFYKFLSEEFNKENILAYYELKSLLDYLLYSKKKMDWVMETTNQGNNQTTFDNPEIADLDISIGFESESSTKYVNTESLDEVRECVKRIQKFRETFFGIHSIYEINIDFSLKNNMDKSWAFVNDLCKKLEETTHDHTQSIEEQLKTIHNNLETLLSALEEVNIALMNNLRDPYQRFLGSDQLYECLALFLSSQGDDSFHVDRILNADKGGVVLNQPESSTSHLKLINEANKNLTSVHPISCSIQLLEFLLNILHSNSDLYYLNADQTIGNMKDEYSDKNPLRLDLNYSTLFQKGINNSMGDFERFIHETFDLAHLDLSLLKSDEEKISFFINMYNMLFLHALIMSGSMPQVEVTNIVFFRKVRYNIGGQLYSLQDMYNGILQCNQMQCLIYGKSFKKKDLRKQFVPKTTFPEVYFGLLNMTKYSPKLRVYNPTTLLESLKQNTLDYFNRYVQMMSNEENQVLEIALPSQLRENKAELKNFWKSDTATVIKTVNNLNQSLNDNMSDATSNASFGSIETVSEIEKRKEVLVYLLENYQEQLRTGDKKLTQQTKYTYKQYQINPPNWFAVFDSKLQQEIMEKFKIEVPASGEQMLTRVVKEKQLDTFSSFFAKFSRTQKLVEDSNKKVPETTSTAPPNSNEEANVEEERKIDGKRVSVFLKKVFRKRDFGKKSFIEKTPTSPTTAKKRQQKCIIA